MVNEIDMFHKLQQNAKSSVVCVCLSIQIGVSSCFLSGIEIRGHYQLSSLILKVQEHLASCVMLKIEKF